MSAHPENRIIRKAEAEDAGAIAVLLLYAMEDIVYTFIGKNDQQAALHFMLHFTGKENNQYSYRNCWVAEINGDIMAAVNVYDGAQLYQLREPVIDHIHQHYNSTFEPEDETAAGEYYIDTLAVHPTQRGKGIGSALLKFLINYYTRELRTALGLLVDEENIPAKQLYLRSGFISAEEKFLFGKKMHHMQISPSQNMHS